VIAQQNYKQDEYFCCSFRFFRVVYAINGHMHDGMRAWQQNRSIILANAHSLGHTINASIKKFGHTLRFIQPDQRYPDQAFAADSSLLFINDKGEKTALMSRMKYLERQGEVEHAREAARKAGFRFIEPDKCLREGSGDTIFDPSGSWAWVKERNPAPANN